jgi:hypothetical protein
MNLYDAIDQAKAKLPREVFESILAGAYNEMHEWEWLQ